jgi:ornithine cyclodeaminase/alanine dehydrogenase-like protein (mu-crystallin family)
LVGSYKPEMAEVDSTLIRRARVLVDSRTACGLEAGELIGAGLSPGDMVEVGELLLRAAPTQDGNLKWAAVNASRVAEVLTGGDVTIFKSVGVGEQDVAISIAVMERAVDMGIGSEISNWD